LRGTSYPGTSSRQIIYRNAVVSPARQTDATRSGLCSIELIFAWLLKIGLFPKFFPEPVGAVSGHFASHLNPVSPGSLSPQNAGTLFHPITVHHKTARLIDVKDIQNAE
jgi:hypothetical protein